MPGGSYAGTGVNVNLRSYSRIGKMITTGMLFTAADNTSIISTTLEVHGIIRGFGVDIPTMGATAGTNSTMQWRLTDEFSALIYESGQISGGIINFTAVERPVAGKLTLTFSAGAAITTAGVTCAFEMYIVPGG